jgi:hypothetical protein
MPPETLLRQTKSARLPTITVYAYSMSTWTPGNADSALRRATTSSSRRLGIVIRTI